MNMKRFQLMVLFSLLIAAAMLASGVGAAPKDALQVSLSAAQSQFSASQDVLVTVTISNPNKNSVRILKWFTPSGGVEEAIFAVKLNGEPVAYTGAVYKRPAATGNDYLSLKAGESLTSTVNLGIIMTFPVRGIMKYPIRPARTSFSARKAMGSNLRIRWPPSRSV